MEDGLCVNFLSLALIALLTFLDKPGSHQSVETPETRGTRD
jgi:hypothetical protein